MIRWYGGNAVSAVFSRREVVEREYTSASNLFYEVVSLGVFLTSFLDAFDRPSFMASARAGSLASSGNDAAAVFQPLARIG